MKAATWELLKNYTTCDISDALVKLGDGAGGFIPDLKRFSRNGEGLTMVGPAYTVELAPLDDPRPELRGNYIDEVKPGSVLIIALSPSLYLHSFPYIALHNAVYGGLMSIRAEALGSVGTVVFGRIRDVDEHLNLKRDVFAFGTGTTSYKSVAKLVATQTEVSTPFSVKIKPGDIVAGDNNGVVVFKDDNLEEMMKYLPKRVDADNLIAKDLKTGISFQEAQRKRRSGL